MAPASDISPSDSSVSDVPPRWRLGSIGFAYPGWNGPFYPRGVDGPRRLQFYAGHFDTIELDTTFYAIPAPHVVERWRDVTPDDFTFCLKAPRDITHGVALGVDWPGPRPRENATELAGGAAARSFDAFLEVAQGLDHKLAVILFQFPPTFDASARNDLERWIERLPREAARYAVELRHDSWWTPETAALFRAHDVAWVAGDEPTPGVASLAPTEINDANAYQPRRVVATTDWLYVRWVGRHDQYETTSEEVVDPTARLAWWVDRLGRERARSAATGRPIGEVFGLVGNTYAGHAPATLRRLQDLLDLPVSRASLFD